MESTIRNHIIDLEIPGVIVLFQSKNQSFVITHGDININQQFKIGSLTKTFMGIIIMQLVEENKLSLDEMVSNYLNIPNITIRQVITMRSGLFDYTKDPDFVRQYDENPNYEFTPQQLLNYGLSHTQNFEPDTDFEYSNTNTIVLGLIIEKITKNKIKQEIYNRITKPLNLTNTSFEPVTQILQNFMCGLEYQNGKLCDVTNLNTFWGWAAGAIVSTVEDLNIYCDYLLQYNKQYYPSHKLLPSNLHLYYGHHLMKLESYYGHNGSLPGYSCYLLCNLDTKIIIVSNIQINKNGVNPANSIAELIVTLILQQEKHQIVHANLNPDNSL